MELEVARSAGSSPRRRAALATIGIAAASLFLALTSFRLTAQGPQYDELFQAPAAFTHLGSPATMFSAAVVHGYPLMNVNYAAAIKSHLYGLYLPGAHHFSLRSWRLLGLAMAALAVLLFPLVSGPALPLRGHAVLMALLLTDGNLLVLGRHDWGPVDLAFLLRMTAIAIWLRGEASGEPTPGNGFVVAALVGFATFEKLSSMVLIPALAVLVLGSRSRRQWRHVVAVVAGLLIGLSPLLAINLFTWIDRGRLMSAADVVWHPYSFDYLAQLSRGYLGLGAGASASLLVFGAQTPGWVAGAEALLAATTIALSSWAAIRWGRRASRASWAGLAAIAYLVVGACLFLIPRATGIHHWVIGSPFQYLALALAVSAGMQLGDRTRADQALLSALLVVTGVWLACRVPTTFRIEREIAQGHASIAFSPDLTRLGELAAARTRSAIFVASDWGVGTQIYCFANGRPGFLHEPFWSYHGVAEIRQWQLASGTRELYLVRLATPTPMWVPQLERDLARSPWWREMPVDADLARLRQVSVRRFLYTG